MPTFASGFVSTSQILDGAVTNAKLASDSVTNIKVADDAIANAEVVSTAAIAFAKLAALTSAQILVGNVSNVPAAVAISGDVALSNAGVATVTDLTITSEAEGDVLQRSATAWVRLAKGTANQRLSMNAGATAAEWQTLAAGASDIAKIDSQNTTTTATVETEMFTKAIAANDFAANDCMMIVIQTRSNTDASAMRHRVRVADGTNTFTSSLAGTTAGAEITGKHFIHLISQDIISTSVLISSYIGLQDIAPAIAEGMTSENATMIAAWLPAALTISIRAFESAPGTGGIKYWLYRIKA